MQLLKRHNSSTTHLAADNQLIGYSNKHTVTNTKTTNWDL